MPAKRPRQARENVTPIKAVRIEAANESRPKMALKMASRRPITRDSRNSNTRRRRMPLNRFSAPIRCSASTGKSC